MDKKIFNKSIELCKHFYEPNSGQFVAEPGKTRECYANSVNITLKVDQNSIPIFTNVRLISVNQIKFDFIMNAYNSSVHLEVAKTFGNGSKLIYWYLDGSKKIYGRFIANPVQSNNCYH